jgi:hypothetical protein
MDSASWLIFVVQLKKFCAGFNEIMGLESTVANRLILQALMVNYFYRDQVCGVDNIVLKAGAKLGPFHIVSTVLNHRRKPFIIANFDVDLWTHL